MDRPVDPRASRTRSSSSARAATSTTCACRGMLHAALVRSPHAHARITSIDTSAAQALPGVVRGRDRRRGRGDHRIRCPPSARPPTSTSGAAWRVDKVRYVGEGVAAIAAPSRATSPRTRADLIEVEYEPLEPVVDPAEAAAGRRAPLVHDALGTNLAYERTFTFGDVDGDFAAADLVIRDRLRWHRSRRPAARDRRARSPASTRHRADDRDQHQHAQLHQLPVRAREHAPGPGEQARHRSRMPAGGSFGSKPFAAKVSAIAGMLAKVSGRPVKYVEDRVDNLTNCDHHGSDRVYDVELALTRDGIMTSLRIKSVDDYGAYIQFGVGHHGNALAQVTGPYRIKSVEYGVTAVLTNKCQQGAYRGFGSEVNNWMLERMVDMAAAGARPRRGRDPPAELHRQGRVPVLHPDRQRLRLRRLRGRARQGARAGRPRPLARRAGEGARGGPLHRHRPRHLPGAQRLQRRPSSGSGSTSRPRP